MSVIIGRALPDVRDGLKPAHRRVLYAMRQMGLASNRPYRKCAKVIGEVIGNYHPHGDQPAYDTLVRLAQDFNMRYLLVDGQGNFGSVDGDPPAAYRYTEARLEALAEEMMGDLDKETVDFVPNFDETTEEPTVLPTTYPNLLVNGSTGIAVGMATNIPPHNMREVIDGVVALIELRGQSKEARLKAALKTIPGPDFPTGGFIVGRQGIFQAYTHRPRLDHAARQGHDGGIQEGRQGLDRHHPDPVPGQQEAAAREHRRPGARENDRGHLRSARRVGPRRHADRHRAEAWRAAGGDPQQPLQAHPAADDVRHHHAGDRRGPAPRPADRRHHRPLHRVPARGGAAADRVRIAQGGSPRAYPRRPEDRPRPPRRGDQAHSRLEESSRGPRRLDDAVQAVAAPVAGDPRHAAPAPDRPRAPEDPRRARRLDEDDRAAARDPVERRAADGRRRSRS